MTLPTIPIQKIKNPSIDLSPFPRFAGPTRPRYTAPITPKVKFQVGSHGAPGLPPRFSASNRSPSASHCPNHPQECKQIRYPQESQHAYEIRRHKLDLAIPTRLPAKEPFDDSHILRRNPHPARIHIPTGRYTRKSSTYTATPVIDTYIHIGRVTFAIFLCRAHRPRYPSTSVQLASTGTVIASTT